MLDEDPTMSKLSWLTRSLIDSFLDSEGNGGRRYESLHCKKDLDEESINKVSEEEVAAL